MARRTILVIEDDPAIRRVIVDALRFDGYEALAAASFAEGAQAARTSSCDLVLLDLVLPGGHGLDLLAATRQTRPSLPFIVMTALGGEDERVRGLSLGADDYVVKPFSVKELLARVAAVLRRSAERPSDVSVVPFAGGVADLPRAELRFADGGRDALSEREAEVLRYLAQRPGRVISRAELLERVWRLPANRVQTRTIDMLMVRLREKLRDDPAVPRVIQTVRGKGYVWL